VVPPNLNLEIIKSTNDPASTKLNDADTPGKKQFYSQSQISTVREAESGRSESNLKTPGFGVLIRKEVVYPLGSVISKRIKRLK
jgi:hypothetical protein